jgi:hypothetical protein
VLLGIFRGPILRFVFLRGQMDAEGVDRMILFLPYHLVGLALSTSRVQLALAIVFWLRFESRLRAVAASP